ncbi:fimbria/pilus outer membrane usher protein [Stenotrophomonas cyclobalanopsidis]|uniref:fimbria/pilus outer membrane usher protein n=1 Tax=Stenotrophomonas cyclobalanopsidis TaxID=2771362 RepID=UPI00345F71CC
MPATTLAEDATSEPAQARYFEPALFRGGSKSREALQLLSRQRKVLPGTYKVDIHVNGQRKLTDEVEYLHSESGDATLCVRRSVIEAVGIIAAPDAGPADAATCVEYARLVPGAGSEMDIGALRLNLTVPQTLMVKRPKGYVEVDALDAGRTIGFVNYSTNYYRYSSHRQGGSDVSSAYLSLNSGFNVGLWQVRHQASASHVSSYGSSYKPQRTYLQRPLVALQSQLTLGETYTRGQVLSGLRFRGLTLESDERMLPDTARGFAPTIRGVAATNARISVWQSGSEIYQTTVAPGPFEINDLYPTSYSGDLSVKILEADGSSQSFSVPYSALPESLRPGMTRYSVSLGRTQDTRIETAFADFTYQRGMSNALTGNLGVRAATGYQAVTLGGVWNNALGAFGSGITHSTAKGADGADFSGWMANLSYSRTFRPTNTVVTLAGYRYSSRGYRDLIDALATRETADTTADYWSPNYLQRDRIELVMNQSIGRAGSLFVSGSSQTFRNARGRENQVQAGYSVAFANGTTVNLTLARQQSGYFYGTDDWDGYPRRPVHGRQTVGSLTVAVPLGRYKAGAPSMLTTTYAHRPDSNSVQASVSGAVGEQQTTSYLAGVSRDSNKGNTVWNGSASKRLSVGSVSAAATSGSGYTQVSLSGQGAFAIHAGGVTFGPYVGETFALVEAKGAAGARLLNAQGITIDRNGYALAPALTPYRYNSIVLDPSNMSRHVEIAEGELRIAPYAGAAVLARFETHHGYPMIIGITLPDGESVPFGAQAFDEDGNAVGLAGQGGLIYLRTPNLQGAVTIRWGDQVDQRCTARYAVGEKARKVSVIRTSAACNYPSDLMGDRQ